MQIRTVFFDLDETLFDHRHASRSSLSDLQSRRPALAALDLDELEDAFWRLVNEMHPHVLAGRIDQEEARVERFRRIFADRGLTVPSAGELEEVSLWYRDAYRANMRPIPGVEGVLQSLRTKEIRIGVVTNNFREEQERKLRACALDDRVDLLLTSEDVGEPKPAPRIFEEALSITGCRPEETVMVGDSWESDVAGALAAKIRPVWLNRYGLASPDPRIAELRSFTPTEDAVAVILCVSAPQ